jgi:hypothetical protein
MNPPDSRPRRSEPVAYAMSPAGGSYRGKAGCTNLMCTRDGRNTERCYGWHCILCDGLSNCQGDCSNPNCPHPRESSAHA